MSSIIAIDPGPTESAYVILEDGKIAKHEEVSNEQMLDALRGMNASVDLMVVEKIAHMGMPAVGEEVFQTEFWSGRFCERWGKKFYRLKRHEIKMHLCGNMRAKDANIRQSLIDKLGPPGKKKSPGATYGISGHCWSALAVAVTFSETRVILEASILEHA